MNKSVNLGLSVLKLSKNVMNKFWFNYVKSKYGKKAKLCYMDTDRFIFYIKTDDIYKDIVEDADSWHKIWYFKLWIRQISTKREKQKSNWFNERWICEKVVKEFVELIAKTYSYIIHDGGEDEKAKGTKKCVIKKT